MFKKCCKAGHRWLFCPCLHGLLWLATGCLFVILGMQILWAYGLYTDDPIPLPSSSLRWIEGHLSHQLPGARIELDRLAISADGKLAANGARVFLEGHVQPILTGDRIELDLSLPYLFLGRLHAESIRFWGVQAYCPLIYSPTGRRERVARAFSGHLSMKHAGLEIRYLHGLLLDIPVSVAGSWSDSRPVTSAGSLDNDSRATEPLLWAAAGLGQILSLRPQADWLHDPHVHLQLVQEAQSMPGFTISARAANLQIGGQLEVARLSFAASLFWNARWRTDRPLILSCERIQFEDYGSARNLDIILRLPDGASFDAASIYRGHADLYAGATGSDFIDMRSVRASVNTSGLGVIQFDLWGDTQGTSLRAQGDFNPLRKSGVVGVALRDFSLRNQTKLAALLTASLPETLQLPETVQFNAALEIAPGLKPSHLRFDVSAEEVRYNGQKIHRLQARGGYLTAERQVSLAEFHAVFPSGILEGSLNYDFDDAQIDLAIQSPGIHPDDLTPILPEWWEELCSDFEFHGRLPVTDFAIRKRFGMHHTLYFFGSVEVWDTSFRGLQFDHGSSLVLGRPAFVEVYNLDGRREERETQGSVSWVFDPAIGGLKSMNWSIFSGIPPEAAKTIFSEDIQSIFEDFEVSGETTISSTGRIFNADRVPELKTLDRVHLSGQTLQPLSYLSYPLDSLAFDADLRPELLQVRLRSVGVAGGEATGNFQTVLREDNHDLQFDIHLRDAHRDRLTQFAARFTGEVESAELFSLAPHLAEHLPASDARVDLQLTASGPRDDPLAFAGTGFFDLHDPDLARIRLFGLLSNILEQTPLPFGTLALNRMVSDVVLDGPLVQFPNMRITGPVTRIKARGDYSLRGHDLDFSAQVFLGNPKESAFLSMITSVLLPLTYALELNLSGPLENPIWGFAYGPGALFSGNRNSRSRESGVEQPSPTTDVDQSEPGPTPLRDEDIPEPFPPPP